MSVKPVLCSQQTVQMCTNCATLPCRQNTMYCHLAQPLDCLRFGLCPGQIVQCVWS